MLMSVERLTKSFGAARVLDDVTFTIARGDRVGVVGANGAGKSTLLRMLAGEDTPDAGTIIMAAGLGIGYLPQVIAAPVGRTVAEHLEMATAPILALAARMRMLEAELAVTARVAMPALLEDYGTVVTRYQDQGGYDLDARVDAALAGLGVAQLDRSRSLASLSGGEKARVGLAVLVLGSPDLLLLDEPTNHLDAASLAWLENAVATYAGAVAVISHDRQFLNGAVNRILAVDDESHRVMAYPGAYDAYARARAQERRQWDGAYARQREEIAALRRRVREAATGTGHGGRSPRDNDKTAANFLGQRVERAAARHQNAAAQLLARIEADPVPKPPKPLVFSPRFRSEGLSSRGVITARGIGARRDGRWLFHDLHLEIGPEARILVVGPNGVGKTTLLRVLAGRVAPDEGEVRHAPSAQVAYLPQEPAPPVGGRTVLDAYRDGIAGPEASYIAGLIGHGYFRLEDMRKSVVDLSVGQRRKLEIARLILERANVLALDEPTNYLSLDVLEAFESAVLGFPGPVIAVSHDRWFMRRFGGAVWELSDGQFVTHDDLGAYLTAVGSARLSGERDGRVIS
ncbi:MAG TPA: ABC-F family ATP-binding cassette domain-containing protein [Ktedonobacterales bacterium]|jgi:macrolide transport system ATP-binding/permease protein